MDVASLTEILQQAIWMMILLSAPILLVSMMVGLSISIFQAVTQIQEATLTFVPKIFAAFLVLAVLSPWFIGTIVDYSGGLFRELTTLAKKSK